MKIMFYPLVRLWFGFSGCARPILIIVIILPMSIIMVIGITIMLIILTVSPRFLDNVQDKLNELMFCDNSSNALLKVRISFSLGCNKYILKMINDDFVRTRLAWFK